MLMISSENFLSKIQPVQVVKRFTFMALMDFGQNGFYRGQSALDWVIGKAWQIADLLIAIARLSPILIRKIDRKVIAITKDRDLANVIIIN